MSDCFDHMLDAFESLEMSESGYGGYTHSYKPKRSTCKFCGTGRLEWRELSDLGWRLCNIDTGKAHKCKGGV